MLSRPPVTHAPDCPQPMICTAVISTTLTGAGEQCSPMCLALGSNVCRLCTSGRSGAAIVNKDRSPDGPPRGRLASFWCLAPAGVAGCHVVPSPAAQMGWMVKARGNLCLLPSPACHWGCRGVFPRSDNRDTFERAPLALKPHKAAYLFRCMLTPSGWENCRRWRFAPVRS